MGFKLYELAKIVVVFVEGCHLENICCGFVYGHWIVCKHLGSAVHGHPNL